MAHPLRLLYRDVDRTPYLFTMEECARSLGLDLTIEQHSDPGGPDWSTLLLNGEVDLLTESYWGLQSVRASGAPLVAIACVVNKWTDRLVVGANVDSVADLKGKRFAVRSTGPQSLFPQLWLRELGIEDVEFILTNEREIGRWLHWTKVADGSCDACMVSPLYLQPALESGLRVLDYAAPAFAGGNVVLTTTETVVNDRRADLQTLVHAAFLATKVLKSDDGRVFEIMRDRCAPLLRDHFEDVGDSALIRMRGLLAGELSDQPVPTAEGIARTLHMRLDSAPELRGFNPLIMWDFSFARGASSRA